MITTPEEYNNFLYQLQDKNPPSKALLLPSEEKIYNIDLDSRVIDTPEFISVRTDHRAEVVYFKCDRYVDSFDLSNAVAVIKYINAGGESRIYPVPFYDLTSCHKENKMLFPWLIEGEATKYAGDIEFVVNFYVLGSNGHTLKYNLTTLPAKSKVLNGLGGNATEEELWGQYDDYLNDVFASQYQELLAEVKRVSDCDFYWIDA